MPLPFLFLHPLNGPTGAPLTQPRFEDSSEELTRSPVDGNDMFELNDAARAAVKEAEGAPSQA